MDNLDDQLQTVSRELIAQSALTLELLNIIRWCQPKLAAEDNLTIARGLTRAVQTTALLKQPAASLSVH
jgi:hypothetical protein